MKIPEIDFLTKMKLFEEDHEPNGYPCVKMKDITRLLRIIERLEKEKFHNFVKLCVEG